MFGVGCFGRGQRPEGICDVGEALCELVQLRLWNAREEFGQLVDHTLVFVGGEEGGGELKHVGELEEHTDGEGTLVVFELVEIAR